MILPYTSRGVLYAAKLITGESAGVHGAAAGAGAGRRHRHVAVAARGEHEDGEDDGRETEELSTADRHAISFRWPGRGRGEWNGLRWSGQPKRVVRAMRAMRAAISGSFRSIATRTDVPAEPRGVKGIRPRAKVDSRERHTFATRSGSVLPVEVARRVEEAARRTRVRVPVIGDAAALGVDVVPVLAVPGRGDPLQMASTGAPRGRVREARGRATPPSASGTPCSPRPSSRRLGGASRSRAPRCRAGRCRQLSSIRSPITTPCSSKNPWFTSSAPTYGSGDP